MKKQSPLPLFLSLVAMGLSLFSVYTVTDFSASSSGAAKAEVGDDFSEKVREEIENFIAEQTGQRAPSRGPIDVSVDDDPFKGDDDAPITIVEFSDYECPFCKRFVDNTFDQIQEEYIDTGKVKYVFRDFPLSFHPNAAAAANAAECVRDQAGDEAYFVYHDVLFDNQRSLDVASLKSYAADLDIDQTEFAACVDEEKFADEVAADMAEGQSYGVSGTPAFFVNGELLSGAQPFAAFKAVIDEALAE